VQELEEIENNMNLDFEAIKNHLGDESDYLLEFNEPKIKKESLHIPGSDFVDRIFIDTDRTTNVLRNLKSIFNHGRLSGTGYLSILPVDQGVEHSAAASFTPNPDYFDPEKIIELAIRGGCNAVASTLGILGAVSRKYAHKIPFIVKINHNELLTHPNNFDQIMFADVEQAWIWVQQLLAAQSILDQKEAIDRFKRLVRLLNMLMNLDWALFCGVIFVIQLSKKMEKTIILLLI